MPALPARKPIRTRKDWYSISVDTLRGWFFLLLIAAALGAAYMGYRALDRRALEGNSRRIIEEDQRLLTQVRDDLKTGEFKSEYDAGMQSFQEARAEYARGTFRAALNSAVMKLWNGLGCHGLARADFIVADDGSAYMLELNITPGMSRESNFLTAAGLTAGCATLFINYLRHQLHFSLAQIVQAAGTTLQQTYERLTGSTDAFGPFASLLEARFPPGVTVDLPNDNPFPLSEVPDVMFEPAKLAGKDVLLSGLVPKFTGAGQQNSFVNTQSPIVGKVVPSGTIVSMHLVQGEPP